jgi:hypothetical protein
MPRQSLTQAILDANRHGNTRLYNWLAELQRYRQHFPNAFQSSEPFKKYSFVIKNGEKLSDARLEEYKAELAKLTGISAACITITRQ